MESRPPDTLTRQLAAKAESMVKNLDQTDYQQSENIDVDNGIYDCDCSSFADSLIERRLFIICVYKN
jgi:hypothetical protein